MKFLLLVLVGRYSLQPSQRRNHRQHQMQFRMLRHLALHEHRCRTGIHPGCQPIDNGFEGVLIDGFRMFVVGGQGMIIRHKEEALILVLQLHPIV